MLAASKQNMLLNLSSLAYASGRSGGRMFMLNSSCNQQGPCLHRSLADNSAGPRDGMSAGLLLPEQWSQQSTGTSFLISLAQLCTKGFHSFFVPLIQQRLI